MPCASRLGVKISVSWKRLPSVGELRTRRARSTGAELRSTALNGTSPMASLVRSEGAKSTGTHGARRPLTTHALSKTLSVRSGPS
jgi:hypothetical protein